MKIATAIAIHPVTYHPLLCLLIKVRARRSGSLKLSTGLAINHRLNGEIGCIHWSHVTKAIAGKPSKDISNQSGKLGSPTASPAILRDNNQGIPAISTIFPQIKIFLPKDDSTFGVLGVGDVMLLP